MKKAYKTVILLIMLILLTSCWDKTELESRGFIVTIGIDKYNGNSGNKRYAVTMSLPDAVNFTENGDDVKTVKSAESETLTTAMRIVDSYSSKRLYFGHTKAAVFGEKLLRDRELLIEAVDALERNRELNRKLKILAAEGEASEILEIDSPTEPLVGMYISNFYKNDANAVSVAVSLDLEKFVNSLRSNGSAILPKITNVSDEARIGGACVIKDFTFAGWLDERQTRGCLWILGEGKGAQIITEFEGVFVPLKISKNKTTVSFYENGGGLQCNINSSIEGNIEEFTLLKNSLSSPDAISTLSNSFEELISGEILALIDTLQNEFKADALSFSEILRKHHWNLYQKYSDDWETIFSDIVVTATVNVKITNTGATR